MASMDPFRGPWNNETKIMLGIDIGTTHAYVSFTILEHGIKYDIHRVTKWPGQDAQNAQSGLPTLVLYTDSQKAVSFGAETLLPEVQEQAEENDWLLVKHFRLHLYPDEVKAERSINPDPLPAGVSLLQVYSDFFGYMLKHTKTFFEDRVINGSNLWKRYCHSMETLITHPNEWGGSEKALLRTAAVAAGFTKEEAAPRKIHFVTEPEALVYFFIRSYNLWSAIQVGLNFIAYYCEDTEMHVTSYTITSTRPALTLRESQHSTCDIAGMLLANDALKQYIQDALTEAGIDSEDLELYISQGITDFKSARRLFSADPAETDMIIDFGGGRINRTANGIRRGRMYVPADKVKSFFQPCVDEIKAHIGSRIQDTHVSFVFSTGEIMDIPYLRQSFEQLCNPQGCQVLFSDSGYTNPGIADGVINWYIVDHANKRRVQMSFGFETSIPFDYNISEHRGRLVTLAPSGLKVIRGRWEEIANQHTLFEQDATFKKPISMTFPTPRPEPSEFKLVLYSYSGGEAPSWMRDKQGRLLGGFREWVTISVNLTDFDEVVESRIGAYGITSWYLEFDICLQFSDVGLSASVQWKEDEEIQTAPATVIAHYVLE